MLLHEKIIGLNDKLKQIMRAQKAAFDATKPVENPETMAQKA